MLWPVAGAPGPSPDWVLSLCELLTCDLGIEEPVKGFVKGGDEEIGGMATI